MKIFISILLVIASIVPALAQIESPKPIYSIESKVEGVSIGTFTIELYPLPAPKHVRYFDSLVAIKFYDSLAFHRVVPGFVIQGGDPNSRNKPRETWGNGDSSQTNIPAEFTNISYARGVLGAARDTDPNSANSQFFICVANAFSLNAQYTAYGRVLTSMNIVDTIVAAPRDANDNPLSKIIMFVTKIGADSSIPAVPTLVIPAQNANRITPDSNLAWSAVPGAILYRLEIATDSNFSSTLFANEIGSSSFRLSTVELGLKKYYWRVYANNGGYKSVYSPVRTFTTAVSIPELQFPSTGSPNQSVNVLLGWSPVNGAVSYHVQVATNALFTQAALVFDKKGITDTTQQMSGLQASKKHYWRVSAETAEYEGAFGLQWNFTTGAATSVSSTENIPTEFKLDQNYPNPFNPATIFRYQIPISGKVSLKIFDMLGRDVVTLVNEAREAGTYSASFDGSELSSGIYFYELRAGSFVNVKKMLLLK